MGNYAVRIYDPALKAWLIAEAARRGTGIRTSDVVEEALRRLRDTQAPEYDNIERLSPLIEALRKGSDAESVKAETGRVGDAPEDVRDAVLRLRPVASDAGTDPTRKVSDSRTRTSERSEETLVTQVPALDPRARVVPHVESEDLTMRPVQREKGPDSGPDEELGF